LLTETHSFAAVRQNRRRTLDEPAPALRRMFARKMIRNPDQDMIKDSLERARKRRGFAELATVVTTVALLVSLVVAATVVSIGIARADTLAPVSGSGTSRFAMGVLLALVIAAMGGLTAVMTPDHKAPRRRH
jgi:uncharacterized membrane protein